MSTGSLKRVESAVSNGTSTTEWNTQWTRSSNSRRTRSSSCEPRDEYSDADKRQVGLELLELRGKNVNLERQLRRTKRYLTDLTNEHHTLRLSNAALLNERDEARATVKKLRLEVKRLSGALNKTTVLLESEREIRMHSEKQLERCQAVLREQEAVRRAKFGRQPCADGNDKSAGLTLEELIHGVRATLMGTVGRWVKGMQAECCAGIRETEIIPWMLQKSFVFCAEVVQERREEVLAFFRGKRRDNKDARLLEDETLDPATAEFMHQHMRRHHRTLFPLAGEERRTAVRQITMGLAQSMMASNEWDPSQRDPEVVVKALTASGLAKVMGALQIRRVEFTRMYKTWCAHSLFTPRASAHQDFSRNIQVAGNTECFEDQEIGYRCRPTCLSIL